MIENNPNFSNVQKIKSPEPYKHSDIMDKTTLGDFSPEVSDYFKDEDISKIRLVMMNDNVYDYFTKKIGFSFKPPAVAVDMKKAQMDKIFKPEAKEIIDYNFDQDFVITMPKVEKVDLKIEGQLVHEVAHYLQDQKGEENSSNGIGLELSKYVEQEHEKEAIKETMRYFKSKNINSYKKVMKIMTEEGHMLDSWEESFYLKLWTSL